jgi:hypothetical protein
MGSTGLGRLPLRTLVRTVHDRRSSVLVLHSDVRFESRE